MKNQRSTTERRLQEEVRVKPENRNTKKHIENVNKQNSKPPRQIKPTGLLSEYLIQLFESGADRYVIQSEVK